jgi:flagellar basal-body rod protein FlgF
MQTGLYVTVAAQRAMQKRLDTIAHNVANASTAGFRAEEVKFETLYSVGGNDPISFATAGATYLSRAAGETVATGNQLDVAVEGDGWLSVSTPAGAVYTRDGRMTMTTTGDLRSLTGYPVLDSGGAPIQLNPAGGTPTIARDGVISQNGRPVAALGLFRIDPNTRLQRYENSGVIPEVPAEPVTEFDRTGVLQGYVEKSNANPVTEIAKLIAVQRTFDAIGTSLAESETTMQDAIKSLGS